MKKEVFKIDENGYIVDKFVANFDEEGNLLDELIDDVIIEQPPDGLYCGKWIRSEWVEDMTQEEIDKLNNQPSLPTQEERIDMLENMILIMMEG